MSIEWVAEYLAGLHPREGELALKDKLLGDECRWFKEAIEKGVVVVRPCGPGCELNTDPDHPRKDEFIVPHQPDRVRHLLSVERSGGVSVNREYIPHITAYARAVLALGYPVERSSFSRYRKFLRDALHKEKGQSYETDAEFYDADGNVYLHLEVKKNAASAEKIVEDIHRSWKLGDMPDPAVKELEYVLDIRPKYLWIVGPGSVDPEEAVYEVSMEGEDARFKVVDSLPPPPGT